MKYEDCKTEQAFKMQYINSMLKPYFDRVFCIETEETVKGFPDVMCLERSVESSLMPHALFFEFKYSNAQGKIKFQPTQPAFYKAHNEIMHIVIIAYNKKTNKIHAFTASCLFNEGSPYYMNEKAEVQL